jgi:subtilisin family serine protease
LLDVALARGISVVAADSETRETAFPASYKGVFAVAAGGAHALQANAFLAPARDIPTTLPGGRWGMVTGASFATAEVTGLVALLRELSPSVSAQQLREALGTSPSDADSTRSIDACAAVARIAGTCACCATVP